MITMIQGDAQNIPLEDNCVQCVITSPPYYGLRDYGIDGQIGLEETPEAYVKKLVQVFREVWRVLLDDGCLWLNLGDSYAGSQQTGGIKSIRGKGKSQPHIIRSKRLPRGTGRWGGGNLPAKKGLKPKDLIGIPWMVAFALRADGWYLRSDIIWHKTNPMPESVKDRPTKAHEYLFLLSKKQKYNYDQEAIREPIYQSSIDRAEYGWNGICIDGRSSPEPTDRMGERYAPPNGRNRRSVWTIPTYSYPGAHFATFPPALVEPCILAGSKESDIVLDPFAGTFTVGMVAAKHRRNAVGIELKAEYIELARKRCHEIQVLLI